MYELPYVLQSFPPRTMMVHIRGEKGGTYIKTGGQVQRVTIKPPVPNQSGAYAAWHPEGRYLAMSSNDTRQYFHSTGPKAVEVADTGSQVYMYDTQTEELITEPKINREEYMNTFPHWSPDGKTLYFCRAEAHAFTLLPDIRYDLYRVAFDPVNRSFGVPECLIPAAIEGKSVSFPRISPDGKYLLVTMSGYGTFSIWHPESDLYLVDLATGEMRSLDELNSSHAESYHSWSSDGRWIVFSSKRVDGLWTYPYIASFDPETGTAGKPFLLPQKDPDFYQTFTRSFNIPELITEPVTDLSLFREAAE